MDFKVPTGVGLAFYYLAESYYREFGNAVLITYRGACLDMVKEKLTIPMEIIELSINRRLIQQFEYMYKVSRIKITNLSKVIANQHVPAGYFLAKSNNVQSWYVMHDKVPLYTRKKLVDKIFQILFNFTLNKSNFVSVSRFPWKGHKNHKGVIYNGGNEL